MKKGVKPQGYFHRRHRSKKNKKPFPKHDMLRDFKLKKEKLKLKELISDYRR